MLVAVAAGGWWFFIREDAEAGDERAGDPGRPEDASWPRPRRQPQLPDHYRRHDDGRRAHVQDPLRPIRSGVLRGREARVSLPLPSKAKGSTKDITGQFQLTADGFDLDTSKPTTFTVDLTTLKSDKSMRDNRVQNQGLETSKYPTATFTATKVTGFDPSLPADQEQTLQLTGTLDLHGVQKDVTWEVKANRDGNIITALATLKFNFADFNIPVLNIANFVSVQDVGHAASAGGRPGVVNGAQDEPCNTDMTDVRYASNDRHVIVSEGRGHGSEPRISLWANITTPATASYRGVSPHPRCTCATAAACRTAHRRSATAAFGSRMPTWLRSAASSSHAPTAAPTSCQPSPSDSADTPARGNEKTSIARGLLRVLTWDLAR